MSIGIESKNEAYNETLMIMSPCRVICAELLLKSMLQPALSRIKMYSYWKNQETPETSLGLLWDMALICRSEMALQSLPDLTIQ